MTSENKAGYPFNVEQRTEPEPNFAVLTPFEFLRDFRLEAQKAKKRVWGQAMAMETGTPQNNFFEAVQEAHNRGLDTRLRIDWFSHLNSKDGVHSVVAVKSLLGFAQRPGPNRIENERMFKTLHENGVDIRFTNYPKLWEIIVPYLGRNHIKMYIVDDIVYLGGVNIEDGSIKGVDLMVKIKDPQVVEAVAQEFLNENPPRQDKKIDFSNGNSLLIDGGRPGKSIILDTAVNLVENAEESVLNTSFFTPDGKFLKALHAAHKRGMNVEVVAPKEITDPVFKVLDPVNKGLMIIKRQGIPITKLDGQLHAKLLIVDGEVVMFGSHNLMSSGVRAGTEEIAFVSTNPELVANLISFYERIKSETLTETP